ncbi:MAG: hypothetical protein AAGI34_16960 [Pseudomonadota bacterium]
MEFMLWMPVFLFFLGFILAGNDAFQRRYATLAATETVADVLSRQYGMNEAALDELDRLQQALLPGVGDPRLLRLTSLRCRKPSTASGGVDETSACVVEATWSCAVGTGATNGMRFAAGQDIGALLPVDLPPLRHQEEILLVELSVPFTAISQLAGLDVDGWYVPLLVKPRYVSRLRIEAGVAGCNAVPGGGSEV